MSLRRAMAGLLLACVAGTAWPQSAVAPTHEVRRGDTLFAVARKAKHDGVTRNQMTLAIFRANPSAFPGGNPNQLEVGTVLTIPSREAVAAIDPAEADRGVRELLAGAQPAQAPQVALARPSAPAAPRPTAEPRVPAGQEEAARKYREGIALEHKGDDKGAYEAFLASAEAGYGLAQKRLGQIYDKGNSVVQRDYQAAIGWYQKARAQGVPIEKPLPRMQNKQ